MPLTLSPDHILPDDGTDGALAGRVWRPEFGGPAVVAIRADGVFDVSGAFPTMADLTETPDPAAALRATPGERVGTLADILANVSATRSGECDSSKKKPVAVSKRPNTRRKS